MPIFSKRTKNTKRVSSHWLCNQSVSVYESVPPPKWPILCWLGRLTLLTHSLRVIQIRKSGLKQGTRARERANAFIEAVIGRRCDRRASFTHCRQARCAAVKRLQDDMVTYAVVAKRNAWEPTERRFNRSGNQIRIFSVARITGVITKSTKAKSKCGDTAKCLEIIGGTGVSLVGGWNRSRRRMTEASCSRGGMQQLEMNPSVPWFVLKKIIITTLRGALSTNSRSWL